MSETRQERTLSLRIPKQLRAEIKEYAARHRTNVTQITLEYYQFLLAQENRQEAEQI